MSVGVTEGSMNRPAPPPLTCNASGGVAGVAATAIAAHNASTNKQLAFLMAVPPLEFASVCAKRKRSSPGAQTERRDDAGPARSLLGGKALPADSSKCPSQNGEWLRVFEAPVPILDSRLNKGTGPLRPLQKAWKKVGPERSSPLVQRAAKEKTEMPRP